MIAGCEIDTNVIHCLLRYHPWYVALFVLSLVGVGIVMRVWKNP
jgi:hypothetical protein